jgi:hypothetical protein
LREGAGQWGEQGNTPWPRAFMLRNPLTIKHVRHPQFSNLFYLKKYLKKYLALSAHSINMLCTASVLAERAGLGPGLAVWKL